MKVNFSDLSKFLTKREHRLFLIIGCAAIISIVLLLYLQSRGAQKEYSHEELRLAWYSGIPSQTILVAQAAVSREQPDRFAAILIVQSVIKGEEVPAGVDQALLRVVFDRRWEVELSAEDRRVALGLGMTRLLRDKTPRDLSPLSTLHPAVVLAVTASSGPSVGRVLKNIPASILTQLSSPFGQAFDELTKNGEELSCGDQAVQLLARFGTVGVRDVNNLNKFLESDTERKLRALALIYSDSNDFAQKALNILLNNPRLSVGSEAINWGRSFQLMKWQELGSSEQLYLLAGIIPPGVKISPSNLAKLFAHPLPYMRAFAIENVLETITMPHPGATDALKYILKKPEILTALQTAQLAQLLQSPMTVSESKVDNWLQTKPPLPLVAFLVISTAKEKEATKLDGLFLSYLKNNGWKPDIDTLTLLSTHPDKLVRLFSYSEVFKLDDVQLKLSILTEATKKEEIPELNKQLDHMISVIKLSQ